MSIAHNHKVKCRICEHDAIYWGNKNGFEIYRCDKCRGAFVYPYLSLRDIIKIYETIGHDVNSNRRKTLTLAEVLEREVKYPNSIIDAKRIVGTIRLLNDKKLLKLLDVGSGYGFFSREALKKGFEITALEIAETERKIFYELTGVKPINSTFEEFNTDETFDALLMSQTLEHSHNPIFWIKKSNTLLNNKGILAVAVPNFDNIFRLIRNINEPHIVPPEHLTYFSAKSIKILLEKNGFHIIGINTASRLDYNKLIERFDLPRWTYKLIKVTGDSLLKLIDELNLGTYLNVYAMKYKTIDQTS